VAAVWLAVGDGSTSQAALPQEQPGLVVQHVADERRSERAPPGRVGQVAAVVDELTRGVGSLDGPLGPAQVPAGEAVEAVSALGVRRGRHRVDRSDLDHDSASRSACSAARRISPGSL
jgi:hypothetical protein